MTDASVYKGNRHVGGKVPYGLPRRSEEVGGCPNINFFFYYFFFLAVTLIKKNSPH